ncbi:MAG: DUF3891 family protein [Actinobacteria bacterium]|nr:DUF3891 family protein [Actinomycetota bacterium]
MILRERSDSYVLIKQHDHALASGEFAKHWARKPRPLEPTLYAIAHHDAAWQGPDASVQWNEDTGRPYSFVDYPPEPKVRAYAEGLDRLEERVPYAACLCSMHYETLVRRFGRSEAEERFADAESRRQAKLRAGMSEEELENLDYNLRLLRLCDGLSLFVCLNEPGGDDRPPPYPGGFEFYGEKFQPMWEDRSTLRLDPNPFSGAFDLTIPYVSVGKDRLLLGSGNLELRVITS